MAYSVPFPSVRFTRSFSFVSVLFFSLKLSVFGTGQAERSFFLSDHLLRETRDVQGPVFARDTPEDYGMTPQGRS